MKYASFQSIMWFDCTVISKKKCSYLSSTELSTRVTHWTEEKCGKLKLLKLWIFGDVTMKSSIDDIVGTPEIQHHIMAMSYPFVVEWEDIGGHIHEMIPTMLATEELVHPTLDGFQWLQDVDLVIFDCVQIGMHCECMKRRPQSACVTAIFR